MTTLQYPDVIKDHVTDAARQAGVTVSQLFQRAAEHCRNGRGFSNNTEVSESFYRTWIKHGYTGLPPAVREFMLAILDGAKINQVHACQECGANGSCHHFH